MPGTTLHVVIFMRTLRRKTLSLYQNSFTNTKGKIFSVRWIIKYLHELGLDKELLNKIQKALTKTEKINKPNIKIKKSSSSKYKLKTLQGQAIETEKICTMYTTNKYHTLRIYKKLLIITTSDKPKDKCEREFNSTSR